MRSECCEKSLGELIDIKHGFAFKGEFICNKASGNILLTPGNFAVGGGFKGEKFKFYNGPVPESFVLNQGDLIITMTDLSKNADTLGYPAIVPLSHKGHRFLHNQRLGKVIVNDSDAVDYGYLYYLMCGQNYRHEVLASATGTTVKHTAPERIKRFRFNLPPLVEQRRIAHILGTLDEKIELNRQMNETLEAIARAIFKSWFVDFDPVRAKMEGRMPTGMDAATATLFPSVFQDSPLGQIPEGWEVVSLPEAIEVNPRRVLKKGTTASYLHMQNLPMKGHRPHDWIHREFSSGTKFINGDTLLARITPCIENGKTGFVDFLDEGEVGWGSTEYIVLRPKPPLPVEFAYYLARSDDLRVFAIHNMTGTTGRQRVPASCFDYYQFPVPITPIAQRFSEIVQPLMEKIRVNSEQSRTLSQIRDALLPKLLSGEIRVDNVDKRLEENDGGTS